MMESVNASPLSDVDSGHIDEVEILTSELVEAHRLIQDWKYEDQAVEIVTEKRSLLKGYIFVSKQPD